MNSKPRTTQFFNSLLFLLVVLTGAPQVSAAALQKSIDVGSDYKPIGWPAEPANVATVFANQTIPEGTTIYYWNESAQAYDIIMYDFGEWTNPLHVFQTARAFYMKCPSSHTFTFNYTPLVSGAYQITFFPNKWYFVTYAWELGTDWQDGYFLEVPWAERYYVHPHLYWPGGCDYDTVIWTIDGTYEMYYPVYRPPQGQDPCSRMWTTIDLVPPYMASRWFQPFWYNNGTGVSKTWYMNSAPGGYN